MQKLTDKQERFVQEYCKDFNATQAAIRAGYSQKTSGEIGYDLLQKSSIVAAVEERKHEIALHAKIDAAWVLRQWFDIATADVNEIMQLRRVCCRHCYGYNHAYQWTKAEYTCAMETAIDKGKDAPDGSGGFGYDINAEPNPACPECGGRGADLLHFEDTRKLTGKARLLFGGVSKGREGIKINLRDQDGALASIARYLGMTTVKNELTGANGAPITVAHLKADNLTDDQLAALIAKDDKPE